MSNDAANEIITRAESLAMPSHALHRASGLKVEIIQLNIARGKHDVPTAKCRFPKGAVLSIELDALDMINKDGFIVIEESAEINKETWNDHR